MDYFSFLRSGRNTFRTSSSIPLGELQPDESSGYECQCSLCANSSSRKWRTSGGDSTNEVFDVGGFADSEDRLLLCPPKVLGYVLHQKIWCQFRIKDISTSAYGTHSTLFEEQLELDDDYKKLLKVGEDLLLSPKRDSIDTNIVGIHYQSPEHSKEKINQC